MSTLEQIVETGSFTSKDRLTEAIEAFKNRAKTCREKMARGVMSIENAAYEIRACNTWIECFTEMRDSL